jgi:hypothetical protein
MEAKLNNARPMRSGIAGMLSRDSGNIVESYVLKYDFVEADENFATPSRVVSLASDGTVYPGNTGTDPVLGILVGNMRVVSDSQQSWFKSGDTVEVLRSGYIFGNIDGGSAALFADVKYEKKSGKTMMTGTALPKAKVQKVGEANDPQLVELYVDFR